MSNTKDWNQNSYENNPLSAQRLYPNEGLLHFIECDYFGQKYIFEHVVAEETKGK